MTWNLGRLIRQTQWVVNQAGDVIDQAFLGPAGDENRYYRDVLNEAYQDEVETAKQNVDYRWFLEQEDVTWPSGQTTLVLPNHLKDARLEFILDITDSYPGAPIWIGGQPQTAQYHWYDRKTLYWGASGPASDRTLSFTYCADPVEMYDEIDEPELIADKFRHLLPWSAASILLTAADREVPVAFQARQRDIRLRWHKHLSLGRPVQTGPVAQLITEDPFF
jgi:hypothetical protein